MRIIGSASLFSAVLLLGGAVARDAPEVPKYDSSEVLVLGEKNHDEFLNSTSISLIEYFAPCMKDICHVGGRLYSYSIDA